MSALQQLNHKKNQYTQFPTVKMPLGHQTQCLTYLKKMGGECQLRGQRSLDQINPTNSSQSRGYTKFLPKNQVNSYIINLQKEILNRDTISPKKKISHLLKLQKQQRIDFKNYRSNCVESHTSKINVMPKIGRNQNLNYFKKQQKNESKLEKLIVQKYDFENQSYHPQQQMEILDLKDKIFDQSYKLTLLKKLKKKINWNKKKKVRYQTEN